MKSRLTFKTLILLAIAPFVVGLTAFWAVHVYQTSHRLILAGFDRKLLTLAGGIAALIDGDAHATYQRSLNPGKKAAESAVVTTPADTPAAATASSAPMASAEMNDPFYRSHRDAFITIQKQASLSYLYTQVYTGDNRIYYVLDGTVGARFSPPGSVDELPLTSREGAETVQYVGRSWVSPIQKWETWGLLKSCFTPVRDASGKVIAMAGADVEIGVIRHKTRWALFAALFIGVCSLIAAGAVSFRIALALTRPIQRLKEATLWIAAGNFETEIATSGSREIADVAKKLEGLRSRLRQEQERSHAWLDELRLQRERMALLHALDKLVNRVSGRQGSAGALVGCSLGDTRVWCFGVADPDPLSNACNRARLAVFARELLKSDRAPVAIVDELLASAPELQGAAHLDVSTGTLQYDLKQPQMVSDGHLVHRCHGTGTLQFAPAADLSWATSLGGLVALGAGGTQP